MKSNLPRRVSTLALVAGLASVFTLGCNDEKGSPGGFTGDGGPGDYSGSGDGGTCEVDLPDHISVWGSDGLTMTVYISGYDPETGVAPYHNASGGYGFDYVFNDEACAPFQADVISKGMFVFDSPWPMEVYEKLSDGSLLKRNVTDHFVEDPGEDVVMEWKLIYDGTSTGGSSPQSYPGSEPQSIQPNAQMSTSNVKDSEFTTYTGTVRTLL